MANVFNDGDWDITKSSMFTGKGLVWGPTEYGVGEEPKAPKDRDLKEFAAFDRSPFINELRANLKAQQGVNQAQAGAQASKLGIGRSSSTAGQMNQIAADTESQINRANYQAALDSFKEQLAQKQYAEQMDMEKYKTAVDKWKNERTVAEAEKNRRATPLGAFSQFVQ